MKLVNRLDIYFVLMQSSNETTPMTKMHHLEMELNQRHLFHPRLVCHVDYQLH